MVTRIVALAGSLTIAALAGLGLVPAIAMGSTANVQIKRIYYIAGAGETSDLRISLVGSNYVLSDPGATISAGAGCTTSGSSAVCSASGIIGITVNLGDGNDIAHNETLTPSTISGGDGNDRLEGGPGNDTLRGNRGLDAHSGGAGDDFIDSRGDKGDVVLCGTGNDLVRADEPDSIASDCEAIDRGVITNPPPPPNPTPAPKRPAPKDLLGPGESRKLRPGACAKHILGGEGNDRLNGTALGDALFGMQGNDVLSGLRGDDCVFGGTGSDQLSGGGGADRLLGDDTKKGAGGNDRVAGNAGNDLLVGGSGNDRLNGGKGSDRISGNDGDDRLNGGPGADRLKGGHGRNRLSGGAGKDRLDGVNGAFDRLNCGPGRDRALADRGDRVRGCERVRRR
jgi:Ca2+-binding RTX toxin-like protein